jgi:hypothetical protein
MKTYVHGYGPKEKKQTGQEATPQYEIEVEYTKDPQWRMPFREFAECEREDLQRMKVHIADHYCDFSVEELPDNEFAIVCLSHP